MTGNGTTSITYDILEVAQITGTWNGVALSGSINPGDNIAGITVTRQAGSTGGSNTIAAYGGNFGPGSADFWGGIGEQAATSSNIG